MPISDYHVVGDASLARPVPPIPYAEKTDIEGTKTATGNPITLSDSAPVNAVNFSVDIEPIQDLNGYDYPWVGGAGKNKVDYLSCVGIGARDGTDSVYASGTTSISGKNLNINYAYGNNGGILKGIKGVPVNFGEYVTISFDVVSLTGSSTFAVGIGDYNGGGTNNLRSDVVPINNKVSVTLDAKSNYTKIGVFIQPANANSSAVITNVQLELGQTATSYAPYSNICPISGRTEENIVRVGVNQYDEEWEVGNINETTGENVPQANVIRTKNYAKILPNTVMYLKCPQACLMYYYDDSYNYIGLSTIQSNSIFTTKPNAKYLRMRVASSYGTTYNHDISINYPSTDTDYHAYQGKTYTIQFGQTVYGGRLDVTKGKLVVDRAMIDLSTVSFTYESNNKRWNRQFSDMKNYSARSADMMFEQYQATISAYTGDTGTAVAYGKIIYIYDANQSLTISGKCVYELATPIEIDLTPTQVKLLENTNTVYSDGGNITLEYQPNNAIGEAVRAVEESYDAIIQNLIDRVTALENQ